MKKSMSQKIICFGIIFIVIVSNIVYAASKKELGDTQDEIDKKIDAAKEDLDGVKTDKSEQLKQIEKLNEQIGNYQDEIEDLDKQIGDLNVSIKDSEAKILQATNEYDKQQELLNERLVVLYEAGETSYLDVLLSSKDITEFISNYYLVSEITSADTELLEKIEKQKKEIEEAKKNLEESKSKLEVTKKNEQTKSNQLKGAKTEKNVQVQKLSEQEKSIQSDIERFEKTKADVKRELAEIARKEEEDRKNNAGNSKPDISDKPSASGYIFPVRGLSRANINNSSYPSYSGHTGIDVNINVTGKTVVAVKAGTVEKSLAYKDSNGYYSYGECVIINHHDGTMTLYAHGLAGSRQVSKGQEVAQGQALMTVGSTGNSSGTHLHFEVRVGGRCVNPMPYLP